ncbi:DUF3939 domain-containing protein [Evansella sp. AB-P1]|uniref:DUF3939 domain-containing protein n=1 Tax=Evansella sp. AB-P1 TaxID=3037653 RepID=UPI00241FB262|nr:DUF3939 domain-containing protein [Evansella sp. AB-P1]MDG5786255.1 DUF3939 domain-containing protein [Evansella sp. AB-P1]
MLFWKKRKNGKKSTSGSQNSHNVPIISATIDDVRKAVNDYASTLQKGVSLRSIVLDNHEIDFDLLHSFLGGKPDKKFYMSKETFEIFENQEYPKFIDYCQIACDQYFLEKGEEPITPGDPYRKISYYKLKNYLIEKPPFELFLHKHDRMVTHRSPR